MRAFSSCFIFTLALAASASAQSAFPSYHETSSLFHAAPGALKYGLYGYENPAYLAHMEYPDVLFNWTTEYGTPATQRFGGFFAFPNMGFGFVEHHVGDRKITDLRFSLAFGEPTFSLGYGFGWSNGDRDFFERKRISTIGSSIRPFPGFSLGYVATFTDDTKTIEQVVDVAIRPLGNELLTVFADFAKTNSLPLSESPWSAGVVIEPVGGLRVMGRYFDNKTATIGLQIGLGHFGASAQMHLDDGASAYNSYSVRLGEYDRNLSRAVDPPEEYLHLDMRGPVAYQRFQLFDSRRTLHELLSDLDLALKDKNIKGVALNTSAMGVNREMLWEIREKLKELKASGKTIVAYIDRGGIDVYHFASIADKIVLDPTGSITLEGYLMGRTFLKGALEKIGVAFDEWRFFSYKSAYESFSRDAMSEADKEQRQKLVDDLYTVAKNDITTARGIEPKAFDALVNERVFLLAKEAVEQKLADTLGRWDTVLELIKRAERGTPSLISPSEIYARKLPRDNYWGSRRKIAVVYALGVCDMDEGIAARTLVQHVDRAVSDASIEAIVLRVDSPGGDAMASDIVAEALKKAKGKKPVIVSQGFVAASGGYWLSMYADTIVAAPMTITGSIGVIGGWFYDAGLKEKLGLTTDHVKAGDHADLGFGFTLPLIGAGIPDRNLTADEQIKMKHVITSFYDDFVSKVADGRKTTSDKIRPIAQGRVWSGLDGKQNGLVDVIGGLGDAIRIARMRAGIHQDEKIDIIQLPPPRLFDLSLFLPSLFGVTLQKTDPLLSYALFRIRNNGLPMPLLPIEDLPLESLYQP